MNKLNEVEKLLKEYKINSARIIFIENQITRMSYEVSGAQTENLPSGSGFVLSLSLGAFTPGRASTKQSVVNESFCVYGPANEIDYGMLVREMETELKGLKYRVGLVEDALGILQGLDRKQKVIAERFYIAGDRMEEIACDVHMSRSRCYELCKEALEVLENVIYGRYMGKSYRMEEAASQYS